MSAELAYTPGHEERRSADTLLDKDGVKSQVYYLFGQQKIDTPVMEKIAKDGIRGAKKETIHRYEADSLSERGENEKQTGLTRAKWEEGMNFFLTRVRADDDRKDFLQKIGITEDVDAKKFYGKYLDKKSDITEFIADIEENATTDEIKMHAEIIGILSQAFGREQAAERVKHLIHGVKNVRENQESFIEAAEDNTREQRDRTSTNKEIKTRTGITFGAFGEKGSKKRGSMEDYLVAESDTDLFGVFDAQGNGNKVHLASENAGREVRKRFEVLKDKDLSTSEIAEKLKSALEKAQEVIGKKQKEYGDIKTTASVIKNINEGDERLAMIGHTGNSRIYLLSAEGTLSLLTKDAEEGLLGDPNATVSIHVQKINSGDKILLATYEAVKNLSGDRIKGILSQDIDTFEMAKRIVKASGVSSFEDRTAIVVRA